MFTAADLIHAVQRKLRLKPEWRLHPPGEFPPGWTEWFASMRVRADAVTGAPAGAMVAVLLARPVTYALPVAVADLTRWQAFASIWRQQWHPPAADERGLRWFAGISSTIIHILLGVMLLWLLFAPPRFPYAPPQGEEMVVQVEYIGEGTPDEVGGGPGEAPEAEPESAEPVPPAEAAREVVDTQPAPAPMPPAEPRPAETVPTAPEIERPERPRPEAVVDVPLPTPPVAPLEIAAPEPVVPEVEQPLTVSEPAPDTMDAFFLPPPVPVVPEPELAVPELEASQAAVPSREVPTPVQAPSLPSLDIEVDAVRAVPEVAVRQPEVTMREVPAPVRRPQLPSLPSPSVQAPELEARTAPVSERSVPTPARETVAATPSAPGQAEAEEAIPEAPGTRTESTASTVQDTAPGETGQAPASPAEPAPRPGSGPRSEPAPGGWPTPARSDDWGVSDREVPGGHRGEEEGIFNSDGSVRLAETPGSASPAPPPGTYTEEITDLDRTGTWLKRPPIGYEPTLFDRYWRPNETLLQEWVRRGIKTVEIPIPGTTKKISCAVSLLALGGGCGISDPNLNEQPAEARPPPDIPFKPELQEDNGSMPAAEPVEDGI